MPYLLTHFCSPVTVRVVDTFICKNYVIGDERLYSLKVMKDCPGYRKGELLEEPAYKIFDSLQDVETNKSANIKRQALAKLTDLEKQVLGLKD